MIKAIIFDADGVLVHREKYFSERLEDEYGIPRAKSLEFFNGEFAECLVGKKDLKKVLPKYLKDWGWKKSLEELMVYWFSKEGKRDEELINYIHKLKKTGIKIFIGTNNEKHRSDFLGTQMGLNKFTDKIYASGYVGFAKPDHKFFKHIVDEQNLNKHEVLFWDDDEENVNSAREFGINAEIYKNFLAFKDSMKNYFTNI